MGLTRISIPILFQKQSIKSDCGPVAKNWISPLTSDSKNYGSGQIAKIVLF